MLKAMHIKNSPDHFPKTRPQAHTGVRNSTFTIIDPHIDQTHLSTRHVTDQSDRSISGRGSRLLVTGRKMVLVDVWVNDSMTGM